MTLKLTEIVYARNVNTYHVVHLIQVIHGTYLFVHPSSDGHNGIRISLHNWCFVNNPSVKHNRCS